MNHTKALLTVIIMFIGMLLGLIILITLPNKKTEGNPIHLFELPKPNISIQHGKSSVLQLIQALKSKRRMDQLMRKDSLNAADSIEIRSIDQHLNQLLHD